MEYSVDVFFLLQLQLQPKITPSADMTSSPEAP